MLGIDHFRIKRLRQNVAALTLYKDIFTAAIPKGLETAETIRQMGKYPNIAVKALSQNGGGVLLTNKYIDSFELSANNWLDFARVFAKSGAITETAGALHQMGVKRLPMQGIVFAEALLRASESMGEPDKRLYSTKAAEVVNLVHQLPRHYSGRRILKHI